MEKKIKVSKYSFKKIIIYAKRKLNYKEQEKEMLDKIRHSQRELKSIDDISTIADNEFIIYGECTTPGILWQEETVEQYNFFITMLGIIDARLDDVEREIDFAKKFDDNERISILEKSKSKYFTLRNEIVSDFFSTYNICSSAPKCISEIVKTYPSHDKFKELYNDLKKNNYSLSLQLKFIDAYNSGYESSLFFYPENIVGEYRKLYADLNINAEKNKKSIAIVKQKHDSKNKS